MTDEPDKFLYFDAVGSLEEVKLKAGNGVLTGMFHEFNEYQDPEKKLIKLEFVLTRENLQAVKAGGLDGD